MADGNARRVRFDLPALSESRASENASVATSGGFASGDARGDGNPLLINGLLYSQEEVARMPKSNRNYFRILKVNGVYMFEHDIPPPPPPKTREERTHERAEKVPPPVIERPYSTVRQFFSKVKTIASGFDKSFSSARGIDGTMVGISTSHCADEPAETLERVDRCRQEVALSVNLVQERGFGEDVIEPLMSATKYTRKGPQVVYVQELAQHGSLRSYLQKKTRENGGVLELGCVKPLLRSACINAGNLTCNGLLHRDLKCDNCVVTSPTTTKLVDLAFTTDEEVCVENLGTAGFKAPEILSRLRTYGAESQVYAFGALVNEACNSSQPYSAAYADARMSVISSWAAKQSGNSSGSSIDASMYRYSDAPCEEEAAGIARDIVDKMVLAGVPSKEYVDLVSSPYLKHLRGFASVVEQCQQYFEGERATFLEVLRNPMFYTGELLDVTNFEVGLKEAKLSFDVYPDKNLRLRQPVASHSVTMPCNRRFDEVDVFADMLPEERKRWSPELEREFNQAVARSFATVKSISRRRAKMILREQRIVDELLQNLQELKADGIITEGTADAVEAEYDKDHEDFETPSDTEDLDTEESEDESDHEKDRGDKSDNDDDDDDGNPGPPPAGGSAGRRGDGAGGADRGGGKGRGPPANGKSGSDDFQSDDHDKENRRPGGGGAGKRGKAAAKEGQSDTEAAVADQDSNRPPYVACLHKPLQGHARLPSLEVAHNANLHLMPPTDISVDINLASDPISADTTSSPPAAQTPSSVVDASLNSASWFGKLKMKLSRKQANAVSLSDAVNLPESAKSSALISEGTKNETKRQRRSFKQSNFYASKPNDQPTATSTREVASSLNKTYGTSDRAKALLSEEVAESERFSRSMALAASKACLSVVPAEPDAFNFQLGIVETAAAPSAEPQNSGVGHVSKAKTINALDSPISEAEPTLAHAPSPCQLDDSETPNDTAVPVASQHHDIVAFNSTDKPDASVAFIEENIASSTPAITEEIALKSPDLDSVSFLDPSQANLSLIASSDVDDDRSTSSNTMTRGSSMTASEITTVSESVDCYAVHLYGENVSLTSAEVVNFSLKPKHTLPDNFQEVSNNSARQDSIVSGCSNSKKQRSNNGANGKSITAAELVPTKSKSGIAKPSGDPLGKAKKKGWLKSFFADDDTPHVPTPLARLAMQQKASGYKPPTDTRPHVWAMPKMPTMGKMPQMPRMGERQPQASVTNAHNYNVDPCAQILNVALGAIAGAFEAKAMAARAEEQNANASAGAFVLAQEQPRRRDTAPADQIKRMIINDHKPRESKHEVEFRIIDHSSSVQAVPNLFITNHVTSPPAPTFSPQRTSSWGQGLDLLGTAHASINSSGYASFLNESSASASKSIFGSPIIDHLSAINEPILASSSQPMIAAPASSSSKHNVSKDSGFSDNSFVSSIM